MIQIKISDQSCVGAARRTATLLANQKEWSEDSLGKLAIVVTELASNIIKHAGCKGELILQFIESESGSGIEILAIDKGPGIVNIAQALQDGYSTQGTAGTGLGAVMRLANFLTIYPGLGQGTVVVAQVEPEVATHKLHTPKKMAMSSICLPKPGEQACGDNFVSYQTGSRALFLIADGLGHGPEAAKASQLACQVFNTVTSLPVINIVSAIDEALRKTRGAAVGLAEIDFVQKTLRFAGLGNITGVMCKDETVRHLMTRDGIAGLGASHVQEVVYPWDENSILILHSDGLATLRGNFIKKYPGLLARHPAVIASVFYRDFNRHYDDITVMAIRKNGNFPTITHDITPTY